MPLVIGGFGSGLGGDDDGSDSEDGSQTSHPSSPREVSGESTGLAPSGGLSFGGGGLNFDLSRPKSPGPSFLQSSVATPKSAAGPSPAPRPSPTSTPSLPVSTPRPSARPSTVPRPSTAPRSSVRPTPASAPAARTAPAPALSPSPAASAPAPAAGLPFVGPASVPDGRSSPQVLGGQFKPAACPVPSRDSEANTLGTLLIRNRPPVASPPAVLTSPAGPPSRELPARATARAGSSLVPKASTDTAPGGLPAPAFSPEEVERAAAKTTSTVAASPPPPPPPPTPTGSPPGPQDSACPSISEPASISEPQGASPREVANLGSEPQQHTEPQAQPPSTDEIEHLVPPRTEPADCSPPEIEEVETPPTRGAALVLAGPPRASSGLSAPRLGGLVAPGLLVAARPEAPRRLGPAAADPNAGLGRLQCSSSSTTSTFTLRAAAAAPAIGLRPAGSLGGGAPLSCFCVQAAQASSSLRSEGALGGSEPSPRATLHNGGGGGHAAQRAVLGGPTTLLTPAKQGPPPSLGLAGNPGSERVGLVGRSGGSIGSGLNGRVFSNGGGGDGGGGGGGGGGGAIRLGSASQRASPYQRVVSTPSLSSSGARVSLLGSGTAAAAGEGGGGSSLALPPRALRGLQRTTSSVSAGGALLSAGASPALGAANPSLSLSRPQAPRPTLRSASQPAQLRSVHPAAEAPLGPSQIDASAHSQVTVARGPGVHPPRPHTRCDPAPAASQHLPRAPSPCVRARASRSCPSSTGSSSRCT